MSCKICSGYRAGVEPCPYDDIQNALPVGMEYLGGTLPLRRYSKRIAGGDGVFRWAWLLRQCYGEKYYGIGVNVGIKADKLGWSTLWMISWLFFFPNSLYMITDFIHISGDKFMWVAEVGRYSSHNPIIYSDDILIWSKLLVIGIGFLFSLLAGLESLHIFQQNIRFVTPGSWSFFGVLFASILSAIGVYIGGFLRFNSWDLFFKPLWLVKEVISKLNTFALGFIASFTLFTWASYILYGVFRRMAPCGLP